jgi:hypothetical protein
MTDELGWKTSRRFRRHKAVALTAAAAMALFTLALTQANALEEEEDVGPDDEPGRQAASGILLIAKTSTATNAPLRLGNVRRLCKATISAHSVGCAT